MATVQYAEIVAASGSADIDDVFPVLHSLLIAAGWTLEYADADAIGTGTAENPAWDKEYASASLAGRAVYRMPANGTLPRWYVRIEPGWGTSSTRVAASRFALGTGHDGSGTLTGITYEGTPSSPAATTSSAAVQMAASEDGFFVGWMIVTIPVFLLVERLRDADDALYEEMLAFQNTGSAASNNVAVIVSPTVGLTYGQTALVLGGWIGSTSPGVIGAGTIESSDGASAPIAGFWMPCSFGLSAPPRIAFFGAAADHSPNTLYNRQIDGALRAYKAAPVPQGVVYITWLVATE